MRTKDNSIEGNDSIGEQLESPLLDALRADLGRYIDLTRRPGALQALRTVMENEGLWATAVYRVGRALRRRSRRQGGSLEFLALKLGHAAWRASDVAVSWVLDIHLHPEADIAPGFYVGHFKSILVGPGVHIGPDCNIGQMCWISIAGPGFGAGAPTLGRRVYVGVGAKIVGAVRVGDDVAIGANAVLVEDVPDGAVVVGNPARVVSYRSSKGFIGVETLDERPASLAAAK